MEAVMDYNTKMMISEEVESGEKLLWVGVPKQGVILKKSDIFMIPFSIFWGGFAISWEYMAISSMNGFQLFPLFGIPFILIGLYLIFGRFFLDAKSREKTFYSLTDKRVIVITTLFEKRVKSLDLKRITEISFTKRSDGYGSIIFNGGGYRDKNSSENSENVVTEFELIENVEEVYRMIRREQNRIQSGE
jgi:hypothetical protein